MTRKICYVSGTRADFGLMRQTLLRIDEHADLALSLLVTGMHLDPAFGLTVREIEQSGLTIAARIPADVHEDSGGGMARGIARMIDGFTTVMKRDEPDIVLLLGDRGEMLAGAIAAIHLNVPVAHIHGGERSGTIDEPVRHAISKLAHLHFTATEDSRERLIRMGERPDRIFVTGAPGLVGLEGLASYSRQVLAEMAGLDPLQPIALMLFHPVHQEAANGGEDTETLLDQSALHGLQVVALMPNSDSGTNAIQQVLNRHSGDANLRLFTHFPRDLFVSWMAVADLMIGNSSAGIIEAATFGTPVINVGARQTLRERNRNVIDVSRDPSTIGQAIQKALSSGRFEPHNIYGDGRSDDTIAGLLSEVPLDPSLLAKSNVY